ncbi:IS200/IS605 family transposase [candidate division KSB1 bacterium]|nr:IS200/IS605 family transposase [candidate division KSB1 bacterium]
MPQSLGKLYTHLVFSTKHQQDMINTDIENELYPYMFHIFREFDSPCLAMNGAPNHLHCLFLLSRKEPLCKVVEYVKKRSSKWIKSKGEKYKDFYWQNGYGAFSISGSHVSTVKMYIAKQKQHHAKNSFQEEYIKLLKRYEIEYDERYIWE